MNNFLWFSFSTILDEVDLREKLNKNRGLNRDVPPRFQKNDKNELQSLCDKLQEEEEKQRIMEELGNQKSELERRQRELQEDRLANTAM